MKTEIASQDIISLMGLLSALALFIGLAIPMTVNCNREGDVLYAQRLVLVDKNNVLQSWDPTLVNPCTWFHLTCDNNNSVIRLDLGSADLSGPLISQLGELTNLKYMNLFHNNLTGPIPSTLGNLTKLVSLDLYQNRLTGVIPPSLGYMENLQNLRLFGNHITGQIPNTLGNLTRLVSLELQHNRLTGAIPSSLGNIKALQYLRLNGNFLTGSVPSELIDLVLTGNLTVMNLSNNELAGTVRSKIRVTKIIQDQKASS